jgi:hypothetical protein
MDCGGVKLPNVGIKPGDKVGLDSNAKLYTLITPPRSDLFPQVCLFLAGRD